jgi:hypothetical protein
MVRVVAYGKTSEELEILRFLSSPEMIVADENHTLPILSELHYREWHFVTLPMVGAEPCEPWFYTINEALDFIRQTLEVRIEDFAT